MKRSYPIVRGAGPLPDQTEGSGCRYILWHGVLTGAASIYREDGRKIMPNFYDGFLTASNAGLLGVLSGPGHGQKIPGVRILHPGLKQDIHKATTPERSCWPTRRPTSSGPATAGTTAENTVDCISDAGRSRTRSTACWTRSTAGSATLTRAPQRENQYAEQQQARCWNAIINRCRIFLVQGRSPVAGYAGYLREGVGPRRTRWVSGRRQAPLGGRHGGQAGATCPWLNDIIPAVPAGADRYSRYNTPGHRDLNTVNTQNSWTMPVPWTQLGRCVRPELCLQPVSPTSVFCESAGFLQGRT